MLTSEGMLISERMLISEGGAEMALGLLLP